MDFGPIIERIDADLEPLMERFINNSNDDVAAMRAALEQGDMKTLVRLGHTAKGTGYGYGMRGMGDIGLDIERAAQIGEVAQCREGIARMARYLDIVTIEYK